MRKLKLNQILYIVTTVIFTVIIVTACASETESNLSSMEAEPSSQIILSDNERDADSEVVYSFDAMPESFTVRDTDIEISLEDCACIYDGSDFRIYAKYISDYSPGHVIYLQTPSDELQIFHAYYYDCLVDSAHETIYIPGKGSDGSFEIYAYSVSRDSNGAEINGWKVLSTSLIEEWLSDTYQLDDNSFFNLQVNSLSLDYDQDNVILKGVASGIDFPSGEKYYIDWEYNTETSEEKITPCILKIYDPELDKDELDACNKAFDAIEQGDWSNVILFDSMEYITIDENPNWYRADVNGDGLPELISQYSGRNSNVYVPIEYIFAYSEGKVELVFADLNDYTEYYFLSGNGNLIYDYDDFGIISYGYYPQCQFDEKWNIKYLDVLEIYYFYDDDTYDEEEIAHLKEDFPDTYGTKGPGYYCFRKRPKTEEELRSSENNEAWVRETISIEEFVDVYRQMTGYDFFKEKKGDWPHDFAE